MWYILQWLMIILIVCLYISDPEMSKNAGLGHIALFAWLVSYGTIYLLRRLISFIWAHRDHTR